MWRIQLAKTLSTCLTTGEGLAKLQSLLIRRFAKEILSLPPVADRVGWVFVAWREERAYVPY